MIKNKPLVSFILLSYNQEKYIKSAIEGALAQEYSNTEFIFSDDCSTDQTFKIIEDITNSTSSTPKKIRLNRNEKNEGLCSHFNKVLSLAEGEIIVVAAGDDISLPTRVSNTVHLLNNNLDVSFISFNDMKIDSKGKKIGRLSHNEEEKTITLDEYLQGHAIGFSGASRGFRRSAYDFFGGLNKNCPTEDTPYILRNLMLGKGMTSPLPGIHYRIHENNLSGVNNLRKMQHSNIIEQYMTDAKCAFDNGLISKKVLLDIKAWVYFFNSTKVLSLESNFLVKIFGYLKLFFKSKLFRAKLVRKLKNSRI